MVCLGMEKSEIKDIARLIQRVSYTALYSHVGKLPHVCWLSMES